MTENARLGTSDAVAGGIIGVLGAAVIGGITWGLNLEHRLTVAESVKGDIATLRGDMTAMEQRLTQQIRDLRAVQAREQVRQDRAAKK